MGEAEWIAVVEAACTVVTEHFSREKCSIDRREYNEKVFFIMDKAIIKSEKQEVDMLVKTLRNMHKTELAEHLVHILGQAAYGESMLRSYCESQKSQTIAIDKHFDSLVRRKCCC
ncbi:MAG: hypothetical protein H6Q67_1274 [Firmicutes bacterium]|nr:hypothetical protein [Bacillota bacterium]